MYLRQIEKRMAKHQELLAELRIIVNRFLEERSEYDLILAKNKMEALQQSMKSDLIMQVPFSERHSLSAEERIYLDAISFACTKINFSPATIPSVVWKNFIEKTSMIFDKCAKQLDHSK